MSDRSKTVDLSQAELDELLTSDKVLTGILADLNAPASDEVKQVVQKALAGYPSVIYGPGGCYIQFYGVINNGHSRNNNCRT